MHGAYDHLWEGFQQLNTRYSTGDFNQKDGGIFIYIRQKNASSILDKWKTHQDSTVFWLRSRLICFYGLTKYKN